MISVGIDLAAEPKGTALALIEFNRGGAELLYLEQGLDDQALMDQTVEADKIGIDCALGWPIKFFEFLQNHQDPESRLVIDGGMDYRRELAYRETDREIQRLTGRWPLSVATDRLGLTAIRAAGLVSKYQAAGRPIDRSGQGKLVEVYPGATLRKWSFDTTNYRTSEEVRKNLIKELNQRAPWLDLGGHARIMMRSSDALDAVIAALAARANHLGEYNKPAANQLANARIEGWICLPTGDLATLV